MRFHIIPFPANSERKRNVSAGGPVTALGLNTFVFHVHRISLVFRHKRHSTTQDGACLAKQGCCHPIFPVGNVSVSFSPTSQKSLHAIPMRLRWPRTFQPSLSHVRMREHGFDLAFRVANTSKERPHEQQTQTCSRCFDFIEKTKNLVVPPGVEARPLLRLTRHG